MKLPPVRISRVRRRQKADIPAGIRPRLDTGNEAELLAGEVNGMKASMPEERMARALSKFGAPFEFRYTLGAPRGLPGWFEVDFVVPAGGLVYAFEIDTSFTHREKGRADVLHDARVIHELEKQGLSVFPTIIHVDGESDLVNQKNAERFIKRFPLGSPFITEPVLEEYSQPVQVTPPQKTTSTQVEQKAKGFQEQSGYRQKVINRKRQKAGLKKL